MRRCVVESCDNQVSTGVECDRCKAEKRRLDELHDWFRRNDPEADDDGRELRVMLYAAVVGIGGGLFE